MISRRAIRRSARKTTRLSSASSFTRSTTASIGLSRWCRRKKRCFRRPANSLQPSGSREVGMDKITRRHTLQWSAAGLAGAMLAPALWRPAFAEAKPYRIGTLQSLSGNAAAGGKTALVGVQMAVDRINKSGGIKGRPIELMVGDDES